MNANQGRLVTALRRDMVETGSLICLGCGYEHNCSTQGCAVMRTAADMIEQQAKEINDLRAENEGIRQTHVSQAVVKLLMQEIQNARSERGVTLNMLLDVIGIYELVQVSVLHENGKYETVPASRIPANNEPMRTWKKVRERLGGYMVYNIRQLRTGYTLVSVRKEQTV